MSIQQNDRCVVCNDSLPDRYKGRERLYCSDFCKSVALGKVQYEEVITIKVRHYGISR